MTCFRVHQVYLYDGPLDMSGLVPVSMRLLQLYAGEDCERRSFLTSTKACGS